MRVLVAGATGLIGGAIVARLIRGRLRGGRHREEDRSSGPLAMSQAVHFHTL